MVKSRPVNLPESSINDRECGWGKLDAEIARTERALHEGQLFSGRRDRGLNNPDLQPLA